ncbi:twin-arginine translocation signal domain-containing protein [Conexibacter stalactiti]|uniref:Twin-arginine translocation signal domain-containing protein n=1 Tax=Conexibacter stalactiti TaxID=1940611 RepID=A0ABU4HNB5_9ACTN|nr:twin-arginine translocation signal domain-containing protein [Conexibacter stalactiti]MDW5594762.1 twin-arginine translocation signal domain-containing protein [Conexibacter stalactiti]MEC5035404.1 twin-arginine translocation signal domain-containing protein [Conexibacter stalactiti]
MIDHSGLDRRSFLKAGGAATLALVGAAAAAPGRASATAAAAASSGGFEPLRRGSWSALPADARGFTAAAPGGGPLTLRLVAVEDVAGAAGRRALAGSEDAFALTLRGRPGLAQGVHALSHQSLGAVELFLAPVGNGGDSGEQTYEIVVDRSVALS